VKLDKKNEEEEQLPALEALLARNTWNTSLWASPVITQASAPRARRGRDLFLEIAFYI
jgi:hypothetical protein